jgi:hypothetical protein
MPSVDDRASCIQKAMRHPLGLAARTCLNYNRKLIIEKRTEMWNYKYVTNTPISSSDQEPKR